MADTAPTCGELYKTFSAWAIAQYADTPVLLFAAGSIQGQAEKVYLGACPASMIRPSAAWQHEALRILVEVSKVYGLHFSQIFYDHHVEYWLYKDTWCVDELEQLATQGLRNTQRWSQGEWNWWHVTRARLCGIPWHEIDMQYHTREGYGDTCESSQMHS